MAIFTGGRRGDGPQRAGNVSSFRVGLQGLQGLLGGGVSRARHSSNNAATARQPGEKDLPGLPRSNCRSGQEKKKIGKLEEVLVLAD